MGTIEFFKESIKNLKTIGTFTRSSKFLCKEMVKHVDFKGSKYLIELGAGDGVITEYILEKMNPEAKLMVFEINEKFIKKLSSIEDPRLIIVQDSAEKIEEYMKKYHFENIDHVVSALPFVIFPRATANQIVGDCKDNLKPGGKFIQVHYSLMARKIYRGVFGNVDTRFVFLNIPPAFVLISQNN